MVVASEIAVDIVKHAFITKFNDITADVGILFRMLNAVLSCSLFCYFFNIEILFQYRKCNNWLFSCMRYNLEKLGNFLIQYISKDLYNVQQTPLLLNW